MEKKDLLIAKEGYGFKIGVYNNDYTRIKTLSDNQVYDISSGYYSTSGDGGNTIAINASNRYDTLMFLPLAVSKNKISRNDLAGIAWDYVEESSRSDEGWRREVIDDSYYVLQRAVEKYFSSQPNAFRYTIGNIISLSTESKDYDCGWDREYTTENSLYHIHSSISRDRIITLEQELNKKSSYQTFSSSYDDRDREF